MCHECSHVRCIRSSAAGLNPSTSGACQGTHISRTKLFAKTARKLWCKNRRFAPMWLCALTCTVDGLGRSHAIDATAPIAKSAIEVGSNGEEGATQ